MLIGDGDVAPALREVGARRDREQTLPGIAIAGDPGLGAHPHAIEMIVHDEVDHARDRVGAVDSGFAAGQHVDVLNEVAGDGVDVDRRIARKARNMATAIDQHQRALRAQIAQIEQIEAGCADPRIVARIVAGRRRALQRRIAGQEIGQVRRAGLLDRCRGQRNDRTGRVEIGRLADAATGDDDGRSGLGCAFVGRLLCEGWRGKGQ